jgi:crotonobetainyl-CoA:carnitine CoA-transferase CaiB-like acyl-CoA transferase
VSAAASETYGALAGVRVLDLSRVLAGPLCGQLLGDHGAQVIKVESPRGDDTRLWGTILPGGTSSYYDSINRNKSNICLDLNTDEDRQTLWRLLEESDVVIENFKPSTMAKWGMDYERDLAPRFPSLIYCRISGYGDDGPLGGLPGYDAALQAYSGLMSVNGEPDRDPMRVGVPLVDTVTGLYAFSGILMALFERTQHGHGQKIECTLFDTSLSLLHPHSAHWLTSGKLPVRTGAAHPSIAPYETFSSARGLFFIAAANDRQFAALADVLDVPTLTADARFSTNELRLANVATLREVLSEQIQKWDPDELSAQLLARGVTASPVQNIAEAILSPQAQHREMLVELGDYVTVGIPIKLGRTPGKVAKAPSLRGADRASVLAALALTDRA